MKKIAFTVCALALATFGFAQKKNVSGAEGKLYDPMDLEGARTMIEAAMKDPTTANEAKTYWVAGEVYYKTFESQDVNRQLNKEYSQATIDECLVKAIDAYKKCYELELIPDAKGKVKQKYSKQIPAKVEADAKYLINAGLANYNEKNYAQAVADWTKYIEVADYAFMAKANMKADSFYTEIKYYTVSAATSAKDNKTAIKYMEQLKKEPKYAQQMYEWLYSTYKEEGNDAKVASTLKEAVDKYPTNSYFIGSLINYYLDNKKDAEAIAYVDQAIAKDPKNAQYYVIKAQLYVRQENFDQAIAASKQALNVDANNFNANFFCGFSYVKKAEAALDKASSIKDNKKYNAAKTAATEIFKEAIPYLEKARQIDAKDANNLNLLKTCYYRVNNGEKYNQIDKELKSLSK